MLSRGSKNFISTSHSKTDIGGKYKSYVPNEKSHGLGMGKKKIKKNIFYKKKVNSDDFGLRSSVVQKFVEPKHSTVPVS